MRGMGLASSARALLKPRYQVRYATSNLRMPAMSPTMTEGGIAGWKKAEGEAFTTGDVLLEIETDKATIDVEAQDDGIMGKIIAEAGSSKIPVGQIIAVLAEEGDDLSSIETPSNLAPEGQADASAESSPSSSASGSGSGSGSSSSGSQEEEPKSESKPKSAAPAPESAPKSHGHKVIKHSKPLFPSVSRLLANSDLTSEQISKLKGTGKNGMLTKGDVLVALGKIKSVWGSAEKLNTDPLGASGRRASEGTSTTPPKAGSEKKEEPLDAQALRRLILNGMGKATAPSKPIIPHSSPALPLSSDVEFDTVLAPYASLLPPSQPKVSIPDASLLAEMESKGLPPVSRPKKDEFAGLY